MLFRRRKIEGSIIDSLSDNDFVRACYEFILSREPDNEGLQGHVERLRRGMPRQNLIRVFMDSPEFDQWRNTVTPLEALHRACLDGEVTTREEEVALVRRWLE